MMTPDIELKLRDVFGIDSDMTVPAFSEPSSLVPQKDHSYIFDPETTLAIAAGFAYNKRVMVQGVHGTGKSSHIEQIAARLNWPCVRINLDSQISRMDLLGKDTIVLQDGKQVTSFQEGILPFCLQNACALVFDEYDAARPDVMFVIQRVLESEGKLTLPDQNRVITPHPFFRIFSTANTIGLGDSLGIYSGTHHLNQGQMDRWNIVASLNYLSMEQEVRIVCSKLAITRHSEFYGKIKSMVRLANLVRDGFINGELSIPMSPRSVISWAENDMIFHNTEFAFRLTFLNKCDESERHIVSELYQRCFNIVPTQSSLRQ